MRGTWVFILLLAFLMVACSPFTSSKPGEDSDRNGSPAPSNSPPNGSQTRNDTGTEEDRDVERVPEWETLQPRQIARGRLPSWSPQGRWLAFVDEWERLVLVPGSGAGSGRILIPSLETDGEDVFGIGDYIWSRDGESILYYLNAAPNSPATGLYMRKVSGGARQTIFRSDDSTIFSGLYLGGADDVHFHMPETGRQFVLADGKTPPERLPEGSHNRRYAPQQPMWVSFEEGKPFLHSEEVDKTDLSGLLQISPNPYSSSLGARWSSDGDRLAVFRDDRVWMVEVSRDSAGEPDARSGGSLDLSLIGSVRLPGEAVAQEAVWSPDGMQLAVFSEQGDMSGYSLWWLDARPGNETEREAVWISRGPSSGVAWSPDRTLMIYDEGGVLLARGQHRMVSNWPELPGPEDRRETVNTGPEDGKVAVDLNSAEILNINSRTARNILAAVADEYRRVYGGGTVEPESLYTLEDGRVYALVHHSMSEAGGTPRVERYEVLLVMVDREWKVVQSELWPKATGY